MSLSLPLSPLPPPPSLSLHAHLDSLSVSVSLCLSFHSLCHLCRYACRWGQLETMTLLLAKGANAGATGDDGAFSAELVFLCYMRSW